MTSIRRRLAVFAAFAALGFGAAAQAQTFPSKPIRTIVPFPPGAIDVYVRMMVPQMEKELGVPVVVETRPGASGFIGADLVARAAPDGYTLVATASGSIVVAFSVLGKAPFDTRKDFTPITRIYNTPSVLAARTALPVTSLKDLIDQAKRNPRKFSYASTAVGGTQHTDMESFKLSAGIDLLHVPYNGFGPVIQALLGQQVDLAMLTSQVAVRLGPKIKVLAAYGTNSDRWPPMMKKVPNMNDVYPDYWSVDGWIGYLGPAGMPAPVLKRLNAAMVKALKHPSVGKKIEDTGAIVVADSPEEFESAMRASLVRIERFLETARAKGIRFE